MIQFLLLITVLGHLAAALQITKPSEEEGWQVSGSHLIQWKSVSGDPANFSIYIEEPGSDAKEGGYKLLFKAADFTVLAESEFTVTESVSTIKPTSLDTLTNLPATAPGISTDSGPVSKTTSASSVASSTASGLPLLHLA
ncbi:hypothetical protein IAU60_003254 [Kwoniella sp. DSM 27419]